MARLPLTPTLTPEAVSAVAESLADEDRGLEHRYTVERVNDPAGKHDDCRYFVLDPKHDPIARVALKGYADEARKAGYTPLADDLEDLVKLTQTREPHGLLAVVESSQGNRFYRYSVEEGLDGPWRTLVNGRASNQGNLEFAELGEVRVISEGLS